MQKNIISNISSKTRQVFELAFGTQSNYLEHFYVRIVDNNDDEFNNSSSQVLQLPTGEILKNLKKIKFNTDWNGYISSCTLKKKAVSDAEFNRVMESGMSTKLLTTGKSVNSKCHFKTSNCESMKFGLRNIVLDFDYHGYDEMEIEYYKEMFMFYANEENIFDGVPMPNFINETPHGIQCWWCFDEISYELKWLYEMVYNKLGEKIDGNLQYFAITLDNLTYDKNAIKTGLFRIPGSNGCKLHLYKNTRYTIDSLKESLDITIKKSKTKKKVSFIKKDGTFNPISRKIALNNYIEKNPGALEGNRNSALLVYASNSAVIDNYTTEDVLKELIEFNNKLINPLPMNELRSIAKSAVKHRYKFTNAKITELFHMEKNDSLFLNDNKTKWQRQNEKRKVARQDKKNILKNKIWEVYQRTLSITTTAEICNCSRPTVSKYLVTHAKAIQRIKKRKELAEKRRLFAKFQRIKRQKGNMSKFTKREKNIINYYKKIENFVKMIIHIPDNIKDNIKDNFYQWTPNDFNWLKNQLIKKNYKIAAEDLHITFNYNLAFSYE